MGLANRVVPRQAREAAIALAQQLAKFPQETLRADRMNAYEQWGKSLPEALHAEWERSKARIADGLQGAARFAAGEGRHGKSRACGSAAACRSRRSPRRSAGPR